VLSDDFLRELYMDELKIVRRPNGVKSKGIGKNLRLVERDYEILKFVLEMGAVSSDVIWIGFFKEEGVGKKYAQNRLSRLRGSDYLISHYTPDGAARWYTATKKAKSFVGSYFELEDSDLPEVRKNIAQGNFFHDKGMCLIRSMLMSKGEILEGSFKSDYLLRSQLADSDNKSFDKAIGYGVPDGLYENREGVRIALEFERNAKSHKNIIKKFDNAQSFKGSDCVLFIFNNESVKRVYLNQLGKLSIYRKAFVFMTYDEFINEYENDFKEFNLLKYMPEVVKESINDSLENDGHLMESQASWSVFLNDESIEYLDYREVRTRKEKMERAENNRLRELEEDERNYRRQRNEYIAWKKKGMLSKVLESGPKMIEARVDLDQLDGVAGWWQ
tara:strand:- start:4 stop:1167 length:1164 start_codon:yes stop_codon:yes gene_type:complete